MPLQHYLPATYLAFFSYDNSGSRRERRIFVGNKHSKKIFLEKTGNICGIHDLYKTTLIDGIDIDKSWSYYEAELDLAIDAYSGEIAHPFRKHAAQFREKILVGIIVH